MIKSNQNIKNNGLSAIMEQSGLDRSNKMRDSIDGNALKFKDLNSGGNTPSPDKSDLKLDFSGYKPTMVDTQFKEQKPMNYSKRSNRHSPSNGLKLPDAGYSNLQNAAFSYVSQIQRNNFFPQFFRIKINF